MRTAVGALASLFLISAFFFGVNSTQIKAESGQAPPSAAPAPPDIWEYAELEHRTRHEGKNVVVSTTRWITGTSDESIGTTWDNVADTLKIPAVKQEALVDPRAGAADDAKHRVLVLNHFGIDGWEICGYSHSTESLTDTWYFKKRIGK